MVTIVRSCTNNRQGEFGFKVLSYLKQDKYLFSGHGTHHGPIVVCKFFHNLLGYLFTCLTIKFKGNT